MLDRQWGSADFRTRTDASRRAFSLPCTRVSCATSAGGGLSCVRVSATEAISRLAGAEACAATTHVRTAGCGGSGGLAKTDLQYNRRQTHSAYVDDNSMTASTYTLNSGNSTFVQILRGQFRVLELTRACIARRMQLDRTFAPRKGRCNVA